MKRLISRLATRREDTQREDTRRAACLCTMGYVDAQGPFAAARALAAAGLELRGYIPIKLSNNISVPRIRASIAAPELIAKRKKTARRILPQYVAALGEGRRFIRGLGPYLIPGALIRRAAAKRLSRPELLLGWDAARCSRCGICVRECPMGCLAFVGDGLSFGEGCSYCTRCYNRCPSQAILPEGEYAPPELYPRYLCPPD